MVLYKNPFLSQYKFCYWFAKAGKMAEARVCRVALAQMFCEACFVIYFGQSAIYC